MPYVKKGAESISNAAAKDVYEKSKAVFEALKKRWTGDKEATETLVLFKEKPDRYKAAIEDLLREKLKQDKEFNEYMHKMLNDFEPELEIFQRLKTAENVTGLESEELIKGKVKVSQEIENAKNVTGTKIKRIG